jgi:membrane peptidoglycan carboxypeptidase
MPAAWEISKVRRRRNTRTGASLALRRLGLLSLGLLVLSLGGLTVGIAYLYLDFAQAVPSVEDIQAFFGPPQAPGFVPIQVYDRTGNYLLAELTAQDPGDRQWLSLNPADPHAAPGALIQATLAAQDPAYWDESDSRVGRLAIRLASDLLPFIRADRRQTIAEQLAANTLLPLQAYPDRSLRRDFRLALLAERLLQAYGKDQILIWYLNSAYYGHMASGADSAAMTYFGKHASQLDLAESAMLAGLPGHPDANPIDSPSEAAALQRRTLIAMRGMGAINQRQASQAEAESLETAPVPPPAVPMRNDLKSIVAGRLVSAFGEAALGRGGLKIISSLDADLQLQSECTLASALGQLAGGVPGLTMSDANGQPCLASGLLPPLRPVDAGVDHNVGGGAVLVTNPRTGEILALAASSEIEQASIAPHPAESILDAFVYVTAFSRGYSPASMVLDLPAGSGEVKSEASFFHGPVRMRTALANGYSGAALKTLDLVGLANVERTAAQMGLNLGPSGQAAAGSWAGDVSLIELGQAFGIFDAGGEQVGVNVGTNSTRPARLSLIIVQRIEDVYGHTYLETTPARRSILSPQLAYLINDVLSDDSARWPTLGQGSVLDLGRPAAALATQTSAKTSNWTVGYTPDRLVGVWIGSRAGSSMDQMSRTNGSAPIWRAILQYASRDLPSVDWSQPPGMSEVEVCDPSGLLPTPYCPQVAKEVFIQGTEPTSTDNLYQPFKVDVETGKLATLFTPLADVEERTFLVPPAEALDWAAAAGLAQPPQEYDPIDSGRTPDPRVHIGFPGVFAVAGGDLRVLGAARGDDFSYYRLQYGQGLDPSEWFQIGQDVHHSVTSGILGDWDTRGLNGVYTLQLLVVAHDGEVKTDAIPVTLDNLAPQIEVRVPQPGETLTPSPDGTVLLEARVTDAQGVDRVEFQIDGELVGVVPETPYSIRWSPSVAGLHHLVVIGYDSLGNRAQSDTTDFRVAVK